MAIKMSKNRITNISLIFLLIILITFSAGCGNIASNNEASDMEDYDENDIEDVYSQFLIDIFADNTVVGSRVEKTILDINNDSVPELIVLAGPSEADYACYIYSYKNDSPYLVDSVQGYYAFYQTEDGEGLYLASGRQGVYNVTLLKINKKGNGIIKKEVSEDILDDLSNNIIELEDVTDSLLESYWDENAAATGTIRDCKVTIYDYRLSETESGKPMIVINFGFTNNSDKATSYFSTCNDMVFQDGMEIDQEFFDIDSSEIDNKIPQRNIQPGKSIKFEKAFPLDNTYDDVVIEVKPILGINNDEKITATFKISDY